MDEEKFNSLMRRINQIDIENYLKPQHLCCGSCLATSSFPSPKTPDKPHTLVCGKTQGFFDNQILSFLEPRFGAVKELKDIDAGEEMLLPPSKSGRTWFPKDFADGFFELISDASSSISVNDEKKEKGIDA